MKVLLASSKDPRGYKTWEEVEAEWDVRDKMIAERKASSVLWIIYYLLVHMYYWVARIDLRYEARKIKWFFDRGRKGWAANDTWDFHGYLARVTKEGIIHLKKYLNGHPGDMTEKQWDDILDELIWTFDMADQVSEGDMHMYVEDWTEEKNLEMKKTLDDMAAKKGYEPYKYMSKAEWERMQKGFQLFVKYYFSLWD